MKKVVDLYTILNHNEERMSNFAVTNKIMSVKQGHCYQFELFSMNHFTRQNEVAELEKDLQVTMKSY